MHTRLPVPIFALIALAAIVLLAGCGGGSDGGSGSESTASSAEAASGGETNALGGEEEIGGESSQSKEAASPEKKAFIRAADALCLKTGKRVFAELENLIPESGIEDATPDELAEIFARAVVPNLEKEIEELPTLGMPAEDTEQVEEVLASLQSDINRGREDPPTFMQEGDPFEATQELALAYGFKVCGGLAPKPKGA